MIRASEGGFTIIEMIISMAIMLAVVGAVFALVDPSQATSRAQPEAADVQQRMRVAADMLEKDLLMAGAGTYSGDIAGTLMNFFPPVLPRRTDPLSGDAGMSAFSDRISIAYVPDTASQTKVRDTMPQPSSEVKTYAQPGCPVHDNLCGFHDGMRVLIYDDTGAYDFFTITQVQSTGGYGHLQHNSTMNPNDDLSKSYNEIPDHARIAQVETHVYWIDRVTNRLHHWDGMQQQTEFVDNAVDLQFRYFGDPNPPTAPRPGAGGSNCLFDATGTPLLPTLPSGSSSLVELPLSMLSDGPPCGVAGSPYDADLYRIRKVTVQLRMQAGREELRGQNPAGLDLFRNPGTAGNPYRRVPDYTAEFDVAPRNLNLVR